MKTKQFLSYHTMTTDFVWWHLYFDDWGRICFEKWEPWLQFFFLDPHMCVFVYLCSFWKAKTFVAVLVPSALLDRHVQEGVHLSAPCDRYHQHQQQQQQHHQQHQQLQGWHRDHPQYLITTIQQSWITTWSPAVCPLTETPRKRRERRNGILKRILKDMH